MTFQPKQDFSFTFGVPCIQNQNPSVRVSAGNVYLQGVDIKVFFSPVQLIFTDMYIQISQPQISAWKEKQR